MLPTLKTNPTAQSKKDPSQTSQLSVHPGGLKGQRSMLKSNLHQENVVTGGLKVLLTFDSRFHPMSEQPTRPIAEAFTRMLKFDELTFSDKNPFPARLPTSNKLTTSNHISTTITAPLLPLGWPKTKSCASARESLSLFNQSHFPKFRIC